MAWTGKTAYDNFLYIGEDVSDIIELISPSETPVLNLLPTADRPATNVEHEWTEEMLGPDRLIASTAVNSVAAGGTSGVTINGFGNQLTVGMLVDIGDAQTEIAQIASIPGPNSLLLTRGVNGGINSLAVGGTIYLISTAELEGSETTGDVNRPRARRKNWTHIFKRPVSITGTDRAVLYSPNTGDEMDHQVTMRLTEMLRDFEKAIFRSVSTTNSIGTASTYRTMKGLREFLTSINSAVAANSFTADPLLYVNDLMQQAWTAGARDIDLLACGATWKRDLSNTNATRHQIMQSDRSVQRVIETLTTDFGSVRLVLTPWLPDKSIMGLSTRRVRPLPLRGRSFQREDLAKTGDANKAHVIGEYTLEVHHPDKMFQARAS